MTIDLRSDTVTKPTPAMFEAMMKAEVGDDVFGEDPTIAALEKKAAVMLGMDSAVFCPSGTMTNQIGIKVLTQPFDEVICYKGSHIYRYEGGGLAGNSHVSVRLLDGNRGRITTEEIAANINNYNDTHAARTSVVALENTVMREAGSYYTLAEISVISQFSRAKGLSLHLDGARLFNALTETGEKASDFGKHFDTISICLSKGLGAPVGSLLACRKDLEHKVRRARKTFGGGMRQAGFLAAGGIFALENHVKRLKEDHLRARELARSLVNQPFVKSVMPVDTNIVIFDLVPEITTEKFLATIADHEIKALSVSATAIRFVTHLDFNDDMLGKAIEVFNKIRF
jgi:threonine aldolase